MIRHLTTTLILVFCGSLSALASEITTVSLRSGVRVAITETITLGKVAEISGPIAERLRGLSVEGVPGFHRDGQGSGSITIQAVRAIVLDAVDESTIVVRGTTCELRPMRSTSPAQKRVKAERASPIGAVLRDQIEAHLRAMYRVNADSIRLEFDDRNKALLNTLIEGRVVEVRATGTGRRVPLSVVVYQGTRVVAEGTVRVSVTLKRSVAVTIGELERGVQITSKAFRIEERWLPADDSSINAEDALGQMTRRRIRAGETLIAAHLEPPLAIRRGDVVTVRSVRGAAMVRVRARALSDGRLGETIELEHLASRGKRADRKRISATVLGPGRAMIGSKKEQG